MNDVNGKPTTFTFDLVHGRSPLIIGMDVRKYCNTYNQGEQKFIRMKRPDDKQERIMFTYIILEDSRLRLDVAPHPRSIARTLLGNIQTTAKRTPLTFCKRIHRYTHATEDEMTALCADSNMMDTELAKAIKAVCEACEVCAKNGAPKTSRKISLTHVNEAFNEELQVDFLFTMIRQTRCTIMNMTDAGTGYTELALSTDRNMASIIAILEQRWFCKHGQPRSLSSDDEYNRKPLREFLNTRKVSFKPRPARRHNKLGIVERKNSTVKMILAKLSDEPNEDTTATLIERAAFLLNMFSGSKILSSFELARGYRPSIMGIPQRIVKADILNAHKEQVAVRTLQRLLHSRAPNVVKQELFNKDDPVWVYYKSTKQNERNEWVRATVVATDEHALIARRSKRGLPMRVAYGDVRFAPRSQLTAELLQSSLVETEHASSDNEQQPSLDMQNATRIPDTLPPSTNLPKHPATPRGTINSATVKRDTVKPPTVTTATVHPDTVSPSTVSPADVSTVNNETTPNPPALRLHLRLRQPPNYATNPSSTLLANKQPTCRDGGKDIDDVTPQTKNKAHKDVGSYGDNERSQQAVDVKPLTRDNTRELQLIHDNIGTKQVSASHLSFASPWIMEEALKHEHDSNWSGAYMEVPDHEVPRDAKIITSHVIYKLKTNEDGSRKLKARIVPHGNHDDLKEDIRSDSSNAPLFVVQILLSLCTFLGFR